jgi:mannose-1-phosphate guanylyltransferase
MPKQLLSILGNRSMLAVTVDRALAMVPENRIWAVTTVTQAPLIKQELESQGFKQVRVIEEPAGRNTAPAIGLAAMRILREDADGILAVMPADHHIRQTGGFVDILRSGEVLAGQGYLVTLGIKPTRAETGYGYICRGERLNTLNTAGSASEAYRVSRFTEKPDEKTAEAYLHSGEYFWNSGIFLWRADRFVEEMKRHLPAHYEGLAEIDGLGVLPSDPDRMKDIYEGFSPISVDYGIMERADGVAMIPADVGWSDVGSWASLREIRDEDGDGNVFVGDVVSLESRNSLVYGSNRLVAVLGLEGFVVVDTPDALLVCREDQSQNVRKIVERLRQDGRAEVLAHRKGFKS